MKLKLCLSIAMLALLLAGCNQIAPPGESTTIPVETTDAPTEETTLPMQETTVPTQATTPETTTPAEVQSPAAAAGFEAVYTEICHLLDTGEQPESSPYISMGILEVVLPRDTREARAQSITYALEDLDGNYIREMVVLDALGNTRILAVYTLIDGQPELTQEGIYRGRLYRLEDNSFYFEGSGGAAYAIFEACGQRWFTYPKGEEQMEIGYYFAADGSYDPATAQEITAEEYNAKQADFAQRITSFFAYPFQ